MEECETRTQGAFVAGGYGPDRGRWIAPSSASRQPGGHFVGACRAALPLPAEHLHALPPLRRAPVLSGKLEQDARPRLRRDVVARRCCDALPVGVVDD